MSSLLGSIFGNAADKADGDSLFAKSETLPERPQHKPVKRAPRKPREEQPEEEEQHIEELPEKKDKKKKRKSSRKDDGDAPNAKKSKQDAENPIENDDVGDKNLKEPSDEDRTIFVGNLPLATTSRKSLAALFKDCGHVVSARIRSVPVKGIKLPQERAGDQRFMKKVCVNTHQVDEESFKNTVSGYVVFDTEEAVTKALEKNNVTMVDGMRIRVDRATPTMDPARSVFVGGLPYAAEEDTLQKHFVKGCDLKLADVEGVRIVRDKETFQCKGFGYVLFRERSMVPTALKLHESMYMKRPIRVMVCGKRFKGKKGQKDASKPTYDSSQPQEKVTVGAFRRIIAKQQQEALQNNKRKRGEKKKANATKAAAGGLSRRAAIEKKVDKKVKKLQKRITKGMGKAKHG